MLFQKYKKDDMTNVNHIGLIMFGLLGDVLLRTPVLNALKEIFPNANITCIVDPIGFAVLKDNPDVFKIITIDRKKNGNKFTQNLKKIKAILTIRKEKFDLLINLYNAGLSRPMVFFSSSRYKLGFCNQKNNYLYNIQNDCKKDRLKKEQRLNFYMMSIIEPLSNKKYSLTPKFTILKQTKDNMQKYLTDFSDIHLMYVLNLGSGEQEKILENEKYFFIVKFLYMQYGYFPAIVSNPGQENFIQECLVETKIPFIKLKTLSLDEIGEVIQKSNFLVTPDTGLMHLAMALDKYIYTLFSYTHPVFVDPQNDKFISVYNQFDNGNFYQYQDISNERLQKKLELLVKRIR